MPRTPLPPALLLILIPFASPFAFPSTKPLPQKQPIKKVAIIGSGIAGLSLAHALLNPPNKSNAATAAAPPPPSITIFDGRTTLDFKTGAGIQLNGGMSVLHKINPRLQQKVAAAGLPLRRIRSRTKPWFGTSSFSTLLELDIADIIRERGGDTEDELIIDSEVMSYCITRGALQEVLLTELPRDNDDDAVEHRLGKTLSGVAVASDGAGIVCEFDDGTSSEPFDVIVGCDGINSAVKEYVDTGRVGGSKNDSDRGSSSDAIYSGIRIQFGVCDDGGDDDVSDGVELRQYFGDGAYALRGTYGAGEGREPTSAALLICADEDYVGPFRRKTTETGGAGDADVAKENADWTQDVRSEDAKGACLDRIRRAGVPPDEIVPVVERSDRFFELGVYFHNPFRWNGWSREVKGSVGGKYAVLVGDAAHAMPPFLGQGGNQAVQSAYCLAEKIRFYNEAVARGDEEVDLKRLLKEYEKQRWRPTTDLTLKAAFLGYLEVGAAGFLSKFRDAFFFTMGKVGVAKKVYLDGATPKV